MKKFNIFIIILAIIFFSGNLFAKIRVESTKGDAAYKKGRQWVPIKNGMTLGEGTKISTGVKSWVVLNIDGDSLKINQLTMMKVSRNRTDSKSKNTHIALKHGSLRARIKKIGKLKTSFKISTPVATSSVRGTEEIVSYGAKLGMRIKVLEGIVEGENPQGLLSYIQGKSVFRQGPNDSKPNNLLSEEKNKSLFRLFDLNSTDDEKKSFEFSGFDLLGDNENPGDFVAPSQDIQNINQTNATVNIDVTWGK